VSWEHWLALGALGVFAAVAALMAWRGGPAAGDSVPTPGGGPLPFRPRRRRERRLPATPPADVAEPHTTTAALRGEAEPPGPLPDFGRRADLPPWLARRLARQRDEIRAGGPGRAPGGGAGSPGSSWGQPWR
jgi:hypothetical protein